MKLVPGIIRKDLVSFGEGLKRIQNIGFKKIEISLQHEIVKDVLTFFEDYGVKAYGMSSFGPSVVGIVESDDEANKLLKAAQMRVNGVGGHIYLCKPNNHGAKIEIVDDF
jgi:beta-ribofuranosylaminobenzene 5'-phosphate synthase